MPLYALCHFTPCIASHLKTSCVSYRNRDLVIYMASQLYIVIFWWMDKTSHLDSRSEAKAGWAALLECSRI